MSEGKAKLPRKSSKHAEVAQLVEQRTENPIPGKGEGKKMGKFSVMVKISDVDKLKGIPPECKDYLREAMLQLNEQRQRKRNPPLPRPTGGISISEAERKYNIPNPTISRWVQKGYIPVLAKNSWIKYIDEHILSVVIDKYLKNPGKGKRTVKNELDKTSNFRDIHCANSTGIAKGGCNLLMV